MELLIAISNLGVPGAFLGASYLFWRQSRRVALSLLWIGVPLTVVCVALAIALAIGLWPLEYKADLVPGPSSNWGGSMKDGRPVAVTARLLRLGQVQSVVSQEPLEVAARPLYLSDSGDAPGRTPVFSRSLDTGDRFFQGYLETSALERWDMGPAGATAEVTRLENSDEDCKGVHDGYRGRQFAGWKVCVDDWYHGQEADAGALISMMKDNKAIGQRRLGLKRSGEISVVDSGAELFVRILSLDLLEEGAENATFLFYKKVWEGTGQMP